MIKTNGKFYLGRIVHKGKTSDQSLLYDPDDLTTHALVVGMTGSGKTGLVIDLLEEAALNNIPALMIDPKGDITNALLHFPDLLPADFQPWVNPDDLHPLQLASADYLRVTNKVRLLPQCLPTMPATLPVLHRAAFSWPV